MSNCPELAGNYVSYTQAAVDSVFAGFGSSFISISLVFFVFTTLMAYYLYSESSIIYLFKDSDERLARIVIDLFKVFFLAAIIFGSLREADFVWALADLGVGSMAWVNVICILILSPVAFRALKEYDDMHKSR